jgi:SAM-dependent methyltransferase
MKLLLKKIKPLKNAYDQARKRAIENALYEQGLWPLYEDLRDSGIDITCQYTSTLVDTPYLQAKVRGLHAFQMRLIYDCLFNYEIYCLFNLFNYDILEGARSANYLDIGDSAGTHYQYLKLKETDGWPKVDGYVSVNVDQEAIRRITAIIGITAVEGDAEDDDVLDYIPFSEKGRIILMFETLEHIENPIRLLKSLSKRSDLKAFILTVPYVRRSRVVLDPKLGDEKEDIHVFELCPGDWKRVFAHCGWEVIEEETYWQYLRGSYRQGIQRTLLRAFLRPLRAAYWRYFDFEGFWGVVLIPKKGG